MADDESDERRADAVSAEDGAAQAPTAAGEQPAATEEAPQQRQVTLSPEDAAMFGALMQKLEIVIEGHRITHVAIGALIRSLASGEPPQLPEHVLVALGLRVSKSGIITVPPGARVN